MAGYWPNRPPLHIVRYWIPPAENKYACCQLPEGKFEIQFDRQDGILKAAVKLFDGSWASRQDPPFYLAIPVEKDLTGRVFIKLESKGEISDIRFAEQGGIPFRKNWQKPENSSKSIKLDM